MLGAQLKKASAAFPPPDAFKNESFNARIFILIILQTKKTAAFYSSCQKNFNYILFIRLNFFLFSFLLLYQIISVEQNPRSDLRSKELLMHIILQLFLQHASGIQTLAVELMQSVAELHQRIIRTSAASRQPQLQAIAQVIDLILRNIVELSQAIRAQPVKHCLPARPDAAMTYRRIAKMHALGLCTQQSLRLQPVDVQRAPACAQGNIITCQLARSDAAAAALQRNALAVRRVSMKHNIVISQNLKIAACVLACRQMLQNELLVAQLVNRHSAARNYAQAIVRLILSVKADIQRTCAANAVNRCQIQALRLNIDSLRLCSQLVDAAEARNCRPAVAGHKRLDIEVLACTSQG